MRHFNESFAEIFLVQLLRFWVSDAFFCLFLTALRDKGGIGWGFLNEKLNFTQCRFRYTAGSIETFF